MAMTDLEVAVQLLGGNTNKVIYDDVGMPSIMVRFDKGTIADVLEGGSENTHHAFSVDGAEKAAFWYSKYQNVRIKCADGLYRAYSLPLQDPKCSINFDDARVACENKGNGWHIGTNAEWAWIALQCRKNGFMPRGNNNYGKDHSRPDEKGIITYTYVDKDVLYNGRVATGSGPKSWAHNNDASGVWVRIKLHFKNNSRGQIINEYPLPLSLGSGGQNRKYNNKNNCLPLCAISVKIKSTPVLCSRE